jgi:hypothetical protein
MYPEAKLTHALLPSRNGTTADHVPAQTALVAPSDTNGHAAQVDEVSPNIKTPACVYHSGDA